MTAETTLRVEDMAHRIVEEPSPSSTDESHPAQTVSRIKEERLDGTSLKRSVNNVRSHRSRTSNARLGRQRSVPPTTLNREPTPTNKEAQSFRICEEIKVEKFLRDRLLILQQQALKRIAKAWIKGICPKKQARFPYENKHRFTQTGLGPEIPDYWPPLDVCRFKEPDHIGKKGEPSHLPYKTVR